MGYRRKPVYRRVECDWEGLAPADGAEPLWCDVLVSLPIGELEVRPIEPGLLVKDAWPELMRRIGAWNVEGQRPDGTWKILPPPGELGDEGWRAVDSAVAAWLLHAVRFAWRFAGDQGKGSSSPVSTDEPSEPGSEPKAKTDPSSRRGRRPRSTASSGST